MTSRRLLPTTVLLAALALAGCGERTGDAADAAAAGSASSPTASPTASSTASPTASPTASGAPATEIPDDFPLAAGMGAEEDHAWFLSTDGPGVVDLELCGERPLAALVARDRLVADNSGGEAANTRDLVLLASADEATEVAGTVAALASSCPEQQNAGTTITTTVGPSPASATAATLVRSYASEGEAWPGTTVHHVVTSGNALLVTSTYGEWTDVERGVAETARSLAPVVEALDLLADPEAEPSADSRPVALPADLDLMRGMPEPGDDYEVVAQTAEGKGLDRIRMCGEQVWPSPGPAPVQRLTSTVSGPEHFEGREVVLHPDEATAERAMAPFSEAAATCRRSGSEVWTPVDADTGGDSVTMGLTYSDGLGSSIVQVTRVGAALVLVTTYGEGSLGSLPSQAAGTTEDTHGITEQLCAAEPPAC